MSNHPHGQEHKHPPAGTYVAIGVILTIITLIEVGVFYVPAFKPVLAPVLLILSAAKFAIVVMFYMHLKFDHKLFTLVFLLPLFIAMSVITALMFLFKVF